MFLPNKSIQCGGAHEFGQRLCKIRHSYMIPNNTRSCYTSKVLRPKFYEQKSLELAKQLLGKVLVKGSQQGIIVETEAYIGLEDKACHAAWRKKESCFPMWGPPGFTYVYLTYGMHYMLNIVTEPQGTPAAVLIRSLEPLKNISLKTSGPGLLTKALGITKADNNISLVANPQFYLAEPDHPQKFETSQTTRIGITYAQESKDLPWRFYIKDNPFVSTYKKPKLTNLG
jgi:DNA-3-methyladenine glycosylase